MAMNHFRIFDLKEKGWLDIECCCYSSRSWPTLGSISLIARSMLVNTVTELDQASLAMSCTVTEIGRGRPGTRSPRKTAPRLPQVTWHKGTVALL